MSRLDSLTTVCAEVYGDFVEFGDVEVRLGATLGCVQDVDVSPRPC